MRYKVFGNRNHPMLMLIHGYGVSWKMWRPHIALLQEKYHIVTPLLPGHDEDSSSDFQSVEAVAEEIIKFVEDNFEGKLFAICGASLGGTITAHILSENRLKVAKAIIDAGPVVDFGVFFVNFAVYTRRFQNWLLRKGNKTLMNALRNSFFPKEAAEDAIKIASRMSVETCKNVQHSAFRYTLPQSIQETTTEIAYWYGSKEGFLMQKSADRFRQLLPSVQVQVFQNYEHGELCIGNPDIFVSNALAFFEGLSDTELLPGKY
ncbi:MAG: alpha/beta hydrolase [Anaerolineales bacterium]